MKKNPSLDKALFDYCLRLGDNSLILGHRLSEWSGHGPFLEEDIALTNIALDLIGLAKLLLTYAAKVEGKNKTEDDLAYLRNEMGFRNVMLVEQPNRDFGYTVAKQFLYSSFSYFLYDDLRKSNDQTLAGIAEKSFKEVTYHVRHSKEWMLRLGDGTTESKQRLQNSLNDLWMYTGELFFMNETDHLLIEEKITVDLNNIKPKWEKLVTDVLHEATLTLPNAPYMASGGIDGKHTEHLGYLLAEMQYLSRAYPGAKW